jgi:hypothetical protein
MVIPLALLVPIETVPAVVPAMPESTIIDPEFPAEAAPDRMVILPVLPPVEEPVISVAAPEFPDPRAEPVPKSRVPLFPPPPAGTKPENTWAKPPVPFAPPVPAINSALPPVLLPEELPTFPPSKVKSPPFPLEDPPAPA